MLITRLQRYASLLLLLPLLGLSACHDDFYDEEDPDNVPFSSVPSGGIDFGVFNPLEHDFASADISSKGDRDGFIFSLSEESVVVIAVTARSGDLDAYCDLYDFDLDFITGDNDGGPGEDPVLVGQLPAGDYVIVVGGEGSSEGDYDLDILTGTLGGLDFGVLFTGNFVSDSGGDIEDVFDADSYFFTVVENVTVDIDIARLSGDYDGNLQIVDQFGQEVGFIDPSGDADPILLGVALTPGTYMVVLAANSGSGDYRISIDVR